MQTDASPAPPLPDRILIIRPSALGDVCRTVPVLAHLRAAFPGAQIDWLVQDNFAPAIRRHPALTSVVEFPRGRFGRLYNPRVAGELVAWLSQLRRTRYDLVLDCQGLARSGFFAWRTGAARRIGYSTAREFGSLALTPDGRVNAPPTLHTVDRMMRLAEAATGASPDSAPRDMRLFADAADQTWARSQPWFARRKIVLAPTSRWPGKTWPQGRYESLVRRLAADRHMNDAAFLVVGSRGERVQVSGLVSLAALGTHVVDLVGATSVGQLMAVIECADLVIASDSAALHMAVGFDRPIIGLFGPTDTRYVGPYRRDAEVIQHIEPGDSLDHKREHSARALMDRISVDEVYGRATHALKPSPAGVAHAEP